MYPFQEKVRQQSHIVIWNVTEDSLNLAQAQVDSHTGIESPDASYSFHGLPTDWALHSCSK
jgi:hypothetical protein